MAVNYKKLVQLYEQYEAPEANLILQEHFDAKELRHDNIDLGRLFAECYGHGNFLACRAREQSAIAIMEMQGAVTTAAFPNISGQIVYSAILEPYRMEMDVFSKLIPERETQFLDGEKMAGITDIGDVIAVRPEGFPYQLAGPGENWIFTPPVLDRGVEVPLTWEAVFNDRTGQLLDRCRDIGKWGGRNREKRAIDCVIDLNTTRHRYNWRGTVIASYGDNSGTHSWDNLSASNALTDWTSLNVAEQNMNALVDPFTGEPIEFETKHLVVTKSLQHVAERILHATEINVATPGYATTGNPTRTQATNPYLNKAEIVTSRLLGARISAGSGNASDWFMGDISAYAMYMVAEKLQVVAMPSNTMEEYRRRIVAGWRVNERGAYVVREPRAINKSTA